MELSLFLKHESRTDCFFIERDLMKKLFMAGAICALTVASLYAGEAKQCDSICKKHHEEMGKMLASIKDAIDKDDTKEAVTKIYEYLYKKHEFRAELKKQYGQNQKLCADKKYKCTKCKGKMCKCATEKSVCPQHADKKCSQCKDKKCKCTQCKDRKRKCMKSKKCCTKVAPETSTPEAKK